MTFFGRFHALKLFFPLFEQVLDHIIVHCFGVVFCVVIVLAVLDLLLALGVGWQFGLAVGSLNRRLLLLHYLLPLIIKFGLRRLLLEQRILRLRNQLLLAYYARALSLLLLLFGYLSSVGVQEALGH